jgi:glucose-6-phosphate 1-dehydrogenase
MAVSITSPGDDSRREPVELVASRHPRPEEMEAYERVLTDAMAGDSTLFARQDYVEEAWRIVDPVLKAGTPVYQYEPHTWGPKEVEEFVVPPRGWDNPVAEEAEDFRVVKT